MRSETSDNIEGIGTTDKQMLVSSAVPDIGRAPTVEKALAWLEDNFPDDVAAELDYDSFGGPDEERQRLRTLLSIGTGDKFLLRQGAKPKLAFFEYDDEEQGR